MAALHRHPRPDLDPDNSVGWRLVLGLAPLPHPPPAPVLLVVLHNGDQFCLWLPPVAESLSWVEVLAQPSDWAGLFTI